MADLLRSGNKMLNMACPICNNPIFRNNEGTLFCPTCNRKVIVADNKTSEIDILKEDKIKDNKKKEDLHLNRQRQLLDLLKKVIYEKIEFITKQLENETQAQAILTYTEILLKFIDILNKL